MSQVNHAPYRDLHLLPIAGAWCEGNAPQSLQVSDPYNGEALLQIKQATRDDLDEVCQAAQRTQAEWTTIGPGQRFAILHRAVQIFDERREEIIGWITRESGSTHIKAQVEWGATRSITLESASFSARVYGHILPSSVPGKESRVCRESLGVVGVISPWNFPLHLTQRSVALTLALGNTVVIEPADDTPVTGDLLAVRIFEEAGIPAGVISVLVGSGTEVGDAFVGRPVPKFISLTGSALMGANINRITSNGEHLKHVALELGGNSPFMVLVDTDLEQAVMAAVMGKLLYQGQICIMTDHTIVEDALYDRFIERYAERIKALKIGDPSEPDAVVRPIIDREQLGMLLGKIARAGEEGARPVVEGDVRGQPLPPHVFADVMTEVKIARGEIFGPLAGIWRARDEAHVLALADDSEFGLSSAVFTADLERGVRFARRVKAGMIRVNDIPVNDEARAPFDGEKNSGLGHFNGEWAIEEFTTDHWISMQMTPHKYPL